MSAVGLHEDLRRKQEGEGGSDRGFGIVFAVFFSVAGVLPLRTHRPVRWWALALAALFLAVALLRPALLGPLNRIWTKLGLLLGRVTSPVVTGVLFYLVFTPIGILFRLIGKDPLHLASDAKVSTYWIAREPAGPAPESMRNQF